MEGGGTYRHVWGLGLDDWQEDSACLCDVESDIGHLVLLELDEHGHELSADDVWSHNGTQLAHAKQRRESVQVVALSLESQHLRDYLAGSPGWSEHESELFEIFNGCLTNREDGVLEPAHADRVELLVEEGLA